MRTCCTVEEGQGHAGGVIAFAEWELPAGFCHTISCRRSSSGQGIYVAQHSLKAKLGPQCWMWITASLCCGLLASSTIGNIVEAESDKADVFIAFFVITSKNYQAPVLGDRTQRGE